MTCSVAAATIERTDIPAELARCWHEQHAACLADAVVAAGQLAAVHDELCQLAVQNGARELADTLGETAYGLRALASR